MPVVRFILPVLLVIALSSPGYAGPQVPPLGAGDLPTAGTCGPLPRENLTLVTIGEVDWYRLDGDGRDLRGEELYEILMARSRAAADAGVPHDVWVAVSRERTWGQVVQVLALCQRTGLFRVGLQVQAESGEGVMGFPLFLPDARSTTSGAVPGARSYALEVRMERPRKNPLPAPPPSSAVNLYAAARKAVQRFGMVVAEASIAREVPVQDAVRAIDLLYRAGCAGVKLPWRVMRREHVEPVVQVFVQGRLLVPEPAPVEVPPIRARKTPWPDSGAAQPGALALPLEPIPSGDTRSPTTRAVVPLPNYAAQPSGVPAAAMHGSGEAVFDWARRLGAGFQAVLRPQNPAFPGPLLVRRKRQGMGVDEFFRAARQTFPVTAGVTVSTARLQGWLFRDNEIVGRVDLTIDVTRPQPSIVYARWVAGPYPSAGVRLPPEQTDPYAGGVPGHLRVWIEGALAAGRVQGASALPLASEAQVLSQLPLVAHAGVRAGLAQRGAGIDNLCAWLRATPYNRLFVEAAEGSAAVKDPRGVSGILRFALAAEGGELALSSLTARAAPR